MPEGLEMKSFLLVAASTLVVGMASPVLAQDHSDHPPESSAPATGEEVDHATMDHSHGLDTAKVGSDPAMPAIDHSQMPAMDYGQLDHSQMDHGAADEPPVDHSQMDHA